MTRRPGMTLVELLVAVALVVAIGALVMPSLLGLVGQERLGAATDRVHSAMILARARAQRESVPVRLVARLGDSGLTELFAIPLGETSVGDGARAEAPAPVLDGSPEGAEAAPAVIRGRPLCVLPDGVWVEEQPPAEAGSESGTDALKAEDADTGRRSPAGASGSSGHLGAAAPVTLSVFLPDGSAAGSPRFLVDSRGRAVQVMVNRWTGLAHFEAVLASTGAHAEEEAPPPAEPESDDAGGAP